MEHKVIVTLNDLEALDEYISVGVDAIIVGLKDFSSRIPLIVDIATLIEIKAKVESVMEIHVALNHLIVEDQMEALKVQISSLHTLGIQHIIFQDFAVLNIIKENKYPFSMHYNPETLNTNFATINYLHTMGIEHFSLAREISLEDSIVIAQLATASIEMQIHGISYVAYSRRHLLTNYFEHEHNKIDTSIHGHLKVRVEDREDYQHIFEDAIGTHMMSETVLCSYDVLDQILDSKIVYLRIDTLFNYDIRIIEAYILLVKAYAQGKLEYDTLKASYKTLFDNPLFGQGFLMDSTVYTLDKIREREENEKKDK